MQDVGAVVASVFERGRAPEVVFGLDALPGAVSVLVRRPSGRYVCVAANDEAVRYQADPDRDTTGLPVEQAVPDPHDRRVLLQALDEAVRRRARVSYRHHRRDGRMVDVAVQPTAGADGDAAEIVLIVTFHEAPGAAATGAGASATARRGGSPAATVRLPPAAFEAAMALCPVPMSVVDVRTHRRVAANPAMAELLGAPLATILGADSWRTVHPDDLAPARRQLAGPLLAGEPTASTTARLLRADGAVVPGTVVATLVPSTPAPAYAVFQFLPSSRATPPEPSVRTRATGLHAVLASAAELAGTPADRLDGAVRATLARVGLLTSAARIDLDVPALVPGGPFRASWARAGRLDGPDGEGTVAVVPLGSGGPGGPGGPVGPGAEGATLTVEGARLGHDEVVDHLRLLGPVLLAALGRRR